MSKDEVRPFPLSGVGVQRLENLAWEGAMKRIADLETINKKLVELVRNGMAYTHPGDDESHCIFCGAWSHDVHYAGCEALAQLGEAVKE